jgi:hypothetical protein
VKYSITTRVYVSFLRYDVPVGFCSFDLSIQGRSVLSNDVCFCFWTVSLTEEIGFDGSWLPIKWTISDDVHFSGVDDIESVECSSFFRKHSQHRSFFQAPGVKFEQADIYILYLKPKRWQKCSVEVILKQSSNRKNIFQKVCVTIRDFFYENDDHFVFTVLVVLNCWYFCTEAFFVEITLK